MLFIVTARHSTTNTETDMNISFNDLMRHTFTPLQRNGRRVPGWHQMYEVEDCEKCGKD